MSRGVRDDIEKLRALERPKHIITIKGDRVGIECQRCKESMETPGNDFGARMIECWPKLHKCPKGVNK